MMASMRLLSVTCIVQVAAAVDAVQPEVVSVSASGEFKTVVRRANRRVDTQASAFAGLSRTDRFAFNRGMNCSSEHGGAEMSSTMGVQLKDCQKSCIHDDGCTCVNFEASIGRCSKHPFCHLENCVPSALVDTYMLHTTLKLPNRNKAAPKRKPAERRGSLSQESLAAKALPSVPQYKNDTDWSVADSPQNRYERSGGRDCSDVTNVPALHTITQLEYHHDDYNLSITTCLTKCQNNNDCHCARYERYYQNECTLYGAGCDQPDFQNECSLQRRELIANNRVVASNGVECCPRSTVYDWYVRFSGLPRSSGTPPPPPPSTGNQGSNDE